MADITERAAELAESWINGNRSTVRLEVMTYEPECHRAELSKQVALLLSERHTIVADMAMDFLNSLVSELFDSLDTLG